MEEDDVDIIIDDKEDGCNMYYLNYFDSISYYKNPVYRFLKNIEMKYRNKKLGLHVYYKNKPLYTKRLTNVYDLILHKHEEMTDICGLENISVLNLTDCKHINIITKMNTYKLNITGCINMKNYDALGKVHTLTLGIENHNFGFINEILEKKQKICTYYLPHGIKILIIENINAKYKITNLPSSIKILRILTKQIIKKVFFHIPYNVQRIDLSHPDLQYKQKYTNNRNYHDVWDIYDTYELHKDNRIKCINYPEDKL